MKKLLVILAAIAMVGAFAVTTMAAEWNFYGSARFATFYEQFDGGTVGAGTEDIDNLQWEQQGNSRIGANVKFNDQIGGRFEMSDSFGKRILYGTYKFAGGGGQLLVGQTYTPSVSFYSNSVYDGDGDLLGIGQFYNSRKEMLQWSGAGFKVALINPVTNATLGGTDTETKLPQIELAYKFKGDTFFIDVFGGYQTYEEKNTAAGDQDVDSYWIGIGGGINFGAFFLKAGIHGGQNVGNSGAYNPAGADSSAKLNDAGTALVDNDDLGYLIVAGWKANDAITIEAGYGAEEYELDQAGSSADDTVQYYINLSYTIAPGFFIVPEIGLVDLKDNSAGVDEGDVSYFGLKTQINF